MKALSRWGESRTILAGVFVMAQTAFFFQSGKIDMNVWSWMTMFGSGLIGGRTALEVWKESRAAKPVQ